MCIEIAKLHESLGATIIYVTHESEYLAAGGRIAVCSSCMKHNGVDEKNLIAGAEVVTADFVVDGIMAAEKSLQLN